VGPPASTPPSGRTISRPRSSLLSYDPPEYEPWPVYRDEVPPDPRVPVLLSLDVELTRSQFAEVVRDLTTMSTVPNLDPSTRYILTALAATCRAKADPKERW
jgi:hypothetical protein